MQIRCHRDISTSRSANTCRRGLLNADVGGGARRESRIADSYRASEPNPKQETNDSAEMKGECYAIVTERGLHADILPGMSAELHENYLGTCGKT